MFDNWTTGRTLRRHVDSLDPARDDEEITAQVSNVLFADAYFAHSIYLVTFARQAAVPAIAKVLYRSGQGDISTDPRRRNNDTIIFFTEFYRRGYKSEAGRAAIQRMEEIHSRFLIADELKLYTLATVMLEPDRLAAQFGEDPFSEVDKQARWNFWCGIAGVMGLELPATTREGFLEWMVDYEARTYAHTADGVGCYEGLVKDWLRWYPEHLPRREWLARQSLSGLLDPTLREMMGVDAPPAFVQAQVNLVAKAYLRSTPYRVFRKDRNLINFFGKHREHPRDLDTVGHVPMRERAGAGSQS
ncbi:MAG: oxygenase MpaB family protein [Solirubrobacterales bacterium]